MIFAGVLAAAAIVFTAGAAIPEIGAIVGTGGFSAAVGSTLAAVGIGTDTLIGSVLAGAVTSAGFGAVAGGAIAGVTGGDIGKGMEMGALTGAVTGGVTGGLNFDPGMGTSAEIASRGAAGASVVPGDVSVTPIDAASVTAPTLPGTAAAPAAAAAPASAGTAGSVASEDAAFAANTASAAAPASSGAAGTPTAATSTPTATASTPSVSTPGNVYTGADGVKYVSDGVKWSPQSSGGIGSFLSNMTSSGPGGSGDFFGKVIGGIGTGLLTNQDATDAAKIGLNRDAAARDATSANYAQPVGANGSSPVSGGGLIRAAANPAGLQKPGQAFNPTARWVLDPVQRRLVLVPATGTTFSTPTA